MNQKQIELRKAFFEALPVRNNGRALERRRPVFDER